jgi:light-harvesting complex 1 beta chain
METKVTMEKSGLYLGNVSDAEAKEFHNAFMSGFYIWLLVAIVAHVLVWMWKPWLTVEGKRAALETITTISTLLA